MQSQESCKGFTSLEKCLQDGVSQIITEFDSNNRQITVEEQTILCREVPCKVLLSSKNILHMVKKNHIKKMIAKKKPITKQTLEKLDKKYTKQSAKLYRDHWLKRQDKFKRIDEELSRLHRIEMILYLEHRKDSLSKNQNLIPSDLDSFSPIDNQVLFESEAEQLEMNADELITNRNVTPVMPNNRQTIEKKIIRDASLSLDFSLYNCDKQNGTPNCSFSNNTQPTQSQPSYNDFTCRLQSRSELPVTSTQEMLLEILES